MKKLILMALAIAAMAACTKSNVEFDQPGEITFQPVAQKATKAAVVGTYYPTDEAYNFNVWAWWADKDAGTSDTQIADFNTVYINNQTFESKDYLNWGGLEKPYYWPTTGSIFFAGYSPSSANGTFIYYSNGQGNTGETDYIAPYTFKVTDYIQSNDIAKTNDLMWFHLTDVSYDRNTPAVPVKFHHALSWLTFRFNLEHPYTPTDWTINSVTLKGIETKGNFTATKTSTSGEPGDATWSNRTVPEDITVYSNNNDNDGYPVTYVTGDYDPLANDPSVLENTKNGVLVIPQPCSPENAELVINFQQVAPSTAIVSQTKTLNLGNEGDAWLPGKHYIYTITFGAEEILISPTVVDWTPVSDLSVPVK